LGIFRVTVHITSLQGKPAFMPNHSLALFDVALILSRSEAVNFLSELKFTLEHFQDRFAHY
jgi:hypothetical protein